MKKKTVLLGMLLVALCTATRPLYGQIVYSSAVYTPATNAVPFFDNAGTPTIGSTQLIFDPGSSMFTFNAPATFGSPAMFNSSAIFSSGIYLAGGDLTISAGNLTVSGTSTFTGAATFNGSVLITGTSVNLGGTNLTNTSGSLSWGGNPVIAPAATPDTGQLLYYNRSNAWAPAAGLYYSGTSIGIGTSATAGYRLSVEGKVRAREMEVNPDVWADFVFDKGYKLVKLDTLEQQVYAHKHLPGLPSAADVAKNGINVGEMDALLLKKIEELTLYIIQQQKEIDALKAAQTNNTSH